MPTFCRFTASDTKRPIFVNPAEVRCARTMTGLTTIDFSEHHTINVTDELDDVIRALEEGLK